MLDLFDSIINGLGNHANKAFGLEEKPSLHGSAGWGSEKEKRRFFSKNFFKKNDGLTIDGINQISQEDSYLHSAIVAPSGIGKTSTYIIPNVLNLNHSMIITDPSGEIFNYTKDHLQSKGFNIRVINPNNLNYTSFYNPLDRANTSTEINKISSILVESIDSKKSSNDKDADFWNNGAKTILNLAIQAVKKHPDPNKNKRNLGKVRELLLLYGQEDSNNKVDAMALELDKWLFDDPAARKELMSFFSNEQKVRDSFITTAKNSLYTFTDPKICQLTNRDTISFEDIKNEQEKSTAIFLIVPEHEIKYYSFLLNLFYTQVFSFCANTQNSKPVFFLLDEFGNMGRLPNFENIITTLRKRNCSISLILQDIKQLNNLYNQDNAEIIFGNCASKTFFSGLSLEMCQKVEAILGKETIEYEDPETKKITLHSRSLKTADEIRRLPRDKVIYIFRNESPYLLDTRYENRK
jgi:type IV secretion system protein VirD4